MSVKSAAALCALASASFAAIAQPPPATPTAPSTPASAAAKAPPSEVAGIPVNYDESKAGAYTLPDPLIFANGRPVRDAHTWTTLRRPELLRIFETQQFGVAPPRPAGESFELTGKGVPALDGKAIRKEITIHLAADPTYPAIHLLEYLPAHAKGPVPIFFTINFSANQNAVDDPGITPQKIRDPETNELVTPTTPPHAFGRIPVEKFLATGIAVATFNYAELDPDSPTGFSQGIRAKYVAAGQPSTNETRLADAWGTISAWAWGISRVVDYLETDPAIDAHRIALHGISRLGKTVTWAAAHDTRISALIASCGGEGGAALSHRDYGETIAHLTAPARYPYQFARNWAQYAGFPDKAPFDANELIALIAPRPVLLQTGSTDVWSDPKGEFLAEVAAGPVYKLLGKQNLGTSTWPAAGTPIFTNGLNYYMHEGGHGMIPTDWDIYLQFLKANLRPAP
ncbi:MAG: acetylxylan esterase [Acidobacteriaceae bacterium]